MTDTQTSSNHRRIRVCQHTDPAEWCVTCAHPRVTHQPFRGLSPVTDPLDKAERDAWNTEAAARFAALYPPRPDTYAFNTTSLAHKLAGHDPTCDCPNIILTESESARRAASEYPACSPQWEQHVIDTIEGVVRASAEAKREKDRITRIMNNKGVGKFRGGVDG